MLLSEPESEAPNVSCSFFACVSSVSGVTSLSELPVGERYVYRSGISTVLYASSVYPAVYCLSLPHPILKVS